MPVLEDLLRTPETNTDPAVPVAQSGPVAQPIEIIITTSDLMELIPSTPQIVMDRGPFGLKNAHTNFYASNHQAQTVTETMFGQEVTIVATPIEYRWDYGDGNTLTTQTPGRPAETFNVETETSHQFTEPGTYTVTLTTVFEGTYQVDGGPTQAVSSTVTQQAEPVEIEIWRAVTRNVDQTCGQNPQAWGC
ncbi:PKD domain-containing protein [Enteractinococcus helveticum]|uniref:PKD domain-containing protein n=1 Tax=Enteractinococcus helveticum TaxID=1837282 RepID=UPI0013728BCC|nr:PKD domain-containing protein [Enteractinococcus helveticum]